MDETRVILFYETCRLCLKKPGFVDMFSTPALIDDIFLCTGVKISNFDNLPPKICMICLEIVINAKRLRIVANDNDKHMKSLFADGSGDPKEEEQRSHILNTAMAYKNEENVSSNSPILIVTPSKTHEFVENIRRKSNSGDISNCITSGKTEMKNISVRKDLFDSTTSVNCTNEVSASENKYSCKKLKMKDKETEYKCEVCKKKFETFKKLYLHRRNHDKKYPCPLDACGKLFATKGDLEKHVRTHTGVRPYECNICHKSFVQRGTLRVHRETVHAELMSETILEDTKIKLEK